MTSKKHTRFRLFLFLACIFAVSFFSPSSHGDQIGESEKRELVAVERFWSILERNPRRGTALDRVYGYYVDTGQISQLIEKCADLTKTDPENGKVWLLQGLILARKNEDLAAIEALQKAGELDTNDAMSLFYLGELLIAQGRLRDAAESLERALERKPAKNDALAILQTLGRVYERFGDQKQSTKVWEKMEELFPNDLSILVRIAETLEEEGKFEDALSRYEKLAVLAKNQNYARVRFTLAAADIKIRLGNKAEAINDFEELLEELATDNWLAESVRDRVERVFVRQADYAGLASYYRKRLDKHPNDLNTVHRLAVALVRLARTDEAKELLQKTLEKAPSNIKLRLALIDLLVNDKDFDEVERQYAIIDELEANNPDYISQWGLAVLENRKFDKEERQDRAANIWLRLVKARPNDVATLVMVADLLAGKDINAEAEVLYKRAVDLAPNDPTYREYLGYFYHRSEQAAKAVGTLKTIAEGERHTVANLAQLSNILYGLGYLKDAMEAVEEAAKLAPNDFALQLRCCELLQENEWLDEAKRQLEVAQKLVETDDELERYTQREIKLFGARSELPAKTDELMRQAEKSAKDWWRLATYLLAAGRLDEATKAIDMAVAREYPETENEAVIRPDALAASSMVENNNTSLLVLKTAADIYAKGYDQQKAATIYEKLATLDAPMRVEHLKKLAVLQRDLGKTDKAIETARLVMATGAGNAANSKFYADMLIAIGRRNDGIEALRRAVRLDPTDTTMLAALADQLAQDGQIAEAIELIWRIYDRTDDLQGKLSVITKLSAYYQMSQQFGQLIERLRQGMHDVNGRREAAYCLAQAYSSVGDYHAARNSLEILLTNVDEEKTNDTFLLDQLSKVAEQQGDMNAAVRYQEMLCDLSSLAQDNDRLLGLYYMTGQRDKATAVYTQKVLEQGELVNQISAIDKMLAREDYRPALTLIERLETKHADHWELLYRKLQAMYWLKDGDPIAVAKTLASLDIEDGTLSLAAEKAMEQAVKQAGITPAMMRQMGYGSGGSYGNAFYGNLGQSGSWAFSSGYASSFWQFKDKNGETHSTRYLFSGEMYDMLAPEAWDVICYDLLPTLFRELLATEDRSRYYGYSSRQSNTVNEEKPQYKPISFGDAKFAAMFWRLKTAFDRDMEQQALESPYAKTESQSTTTAEKASLNLSSNCNCGPYYSDLDLSTDDADEEDLGYDFFAEKSLWETGTQPAVQSGMPTLAEPQIAEDARPTGEPTLAEPALAEPTLAEPRAANDAKGKGSNDGSDFPQFNAMLEELLATLPDDPQADVQNAEAIENRLRFEVFLGHWVTLNRDLGTVTPLKKHSTPETTARVESLATRLAFVSDDPYWKRRLFRSIFDEVSDTVLLSYYESLDLENHWGELPDDLSQNEQACASIRKLIARHVENIRNRIAKKAQGHSPVSLENKIDWLVKTYVRMSHEEASEFESQIMLCRQFCDLLKYSGREDDVSRVENAFGYAGNINPECFYRLATAPYSPFEFLPTPVGNAVMNEAPFRDFGHEQKVEQLQHWTRKGTQALANNVRMLLHDDTFALSQENVISFLTRNNSHYNDDPSPFGDLFGKKYLIGFLESEPEKIWESDLYTELRYLVNNGEAFNSLEVITAALSAKSRRGTPVAPDRSSHIYDFYQTLNPSSKDEKASIEKTLTMTKDKLAAIDVWQDKLKSVLDLRFETLCEIMPVRDEFIKETSLSLRPSAQKMRAANQRSLMTYGERFFNRHYEFDKDDMDEILGMHQSQNQSVGETPTENEFYDSMITAVELHAIAADVMLSISKPGPDVEASDLQPRFGEFFKTYIAEKATSENELEQRFAQAYVDAREKMIAENAAKNEELSDQKMETVYSQFLEEYQLAKANGQIWPDEKLFLLAVLAHKNKKYNLTIECLDAMKLTAATDIKKRENLFLMMHQQAVSNKILQARAEEAIDRLLGYQLTSEELSHVRTLLKRFDRAGESAAIRDRLLVSATDSRTQYTLLQELNREGEKSKEQAIQYALKVFRSPAMLSPQALQSDNINRELKNLAITVLKKHGKLEEIIEQIEEQWKSSPGATDIMISLADIYSRNNRDEDAKRIAEEIGKQVPDDAQKMLEYVQLLRQVGMREEAIDWTCKAIEKEPARLFNDFWELERTFRNAKQTPRLIEMLRNMDAAIIENHIYQLRYQLSSWLQAESTREMTLQLIDSLWNNEKASEKQLQSIRHSLLVQMCEEPRKEYYVYLKDSMSEIIDASRKDDDAYLYLAFDFIQLAEALMTAAKANDAYDAMKVEIRERVAANEKIADADKNMQAIVNGLLIEAHMELKEENFERTCEILKKIFIDEQLSDVASEQMSLFVTQIAEMPNIDASLVEMMIEHLVAELNDDPEIAREWEQTPGMKSTLVELYFKSDRPERGIGPAVSGVRLCLQYASQCFDNNDYPEVEVGDETYSIYELSECLEEYARLMKDAGFNFELWLVYQAECIGETWYEEMEHHDHMQYYASSFKQPFEGLIERVTPENVAEHIEMFIPGLVEKSDVSDATETEKTSNHGLIETAEEVFDDLLPLNAAHLPFHSKTVNSSTEGAIRNAFRFLAESAFQSEGKSLNSPLISSLLFDALKYIAAEDRAAFDRIVATLDRFIAENPEEPTLVVVKLLCAIASADVAVAGEQMSKTADWLDGLPQEKTLQFAYPVYVSVWLAVRETFTDQETFAPDMFAESQERLLRWLNMAKSIGYNDDGTSNGNETESRLIPNRIVGAMTFEMQRTVPNVLLGKLKSSDDK